MDPERLEELFFAALELDGEEREAFLRRSEAASPDLVHEVRSLLAGHERVEQRFLTPPLPDDLVGRRLGAFQLVRLIGQGGSGSVYEARQYDWLRLPEDITHYD